MTIESAGLALHNSTREPPQVSPLPFHRAIEAHWREHRPGMVKSLEAKGQLQAAVDRAANRTADAESAAIRNGMPAPQAMEIYREMWAFLPSEAHEPALSADRDPDSPPPTGNGPA